MKYLIRFNNNANILRIPINELDRIPKEDEELEVTEKRLEILKGDNIYKVNFIKKAIPLKEKEEPKK